MSSSAVRFVPPVLSVGGPTDPTRQALALVRELLSVRGLGTMSDRDVRAKLVEVDALLARAVGGPTDPTGPK